MRTHCIIFKQKGLRSVGAYWAVPLMERQNLIDFPDASVQNCVVPTALNTSLGFMFQRTLKFLGHRRSKAFSKSTSNASTFRYNVPRQCHECHSQSQCSSCCYKSDVAPGQLGELFAVVLPFVGMLSSLLARVIGL